jgi:predicted nucleic acid-binding protein
LVDTGVWSRHFREGVPELVDALRMSRVVIHPWIIGELALGPGLRLGTLSDLEVLPRVDVVSDDRLLAFIKLHGLRGVGWVDAQLLLSAMVAGVDLWTTDTKLGELHSTLAPPPS